MKKYSIILFFYLMTLCQGVFADPSYSFELETTAGKLSSKSLRGQVVLVDFWASWCIPCRASFPWMDEIQKRYKDQGLVILAINLDTDQKLAQQFLEKRSLDLIIGFDPTAKIAEQFGLIAMPSSYLFDRNGQLISQHIGFKKAKRESYENSIKRTLGASS
jgi:thiol-disulfide isomerase/thioredoxin